MSKDRQTFEGGVAVITGAGAGIGMGLALYAGELGMTVVVTDVSAERAENVAQQIIAKGGKAEAKVVDVSVPSELDRLADEVFARYGSCRLLINNAGIETIGNTWEIPTERWEATLNINIHGIVHGVRAFTPKMIEKGEEAWIANLGSIGSFGIMPTQTAYIMTKHAIQSFSECLFLEMENAGAPINVASILPGLVKTSIFNAEEGKGEPDTSSRRRQIMHDMMAAHGMSVEDAAKTIFEQLANKGFWVSTHPDMTDEAINGRIEFLKKREKPALNEQTRSLL